MLIGFFNYFETGMGMRIFIRTGETSEEIKKGIDDYFLIGLEVIELKKVIESIKHPERMNKKIKELLMLLEIYSPIAYKNLIEYSHIDLDFQYAINLS